MLPIPTKPMRFVSLMMISPADPDHVVFGRESEARYAAIALAHRVRMEDGSAARADEPASSDCRARAHLWSCRAGRSPKRVEDARKRADGSPARRAGHGRMSDTGWLWVVFTLIAAGAQTVRNATQRELTAKLGTVGATH